MEPPVNMPSAEPRALAGPAYRATPRARAAIVAASVAALLAAAATGLAAPTFHAGATAPRLSGSRPRYQMHVIGRLPGSAASLPQSVDVEGDVAGLSGYVAGTSPSASPTAQANYPFDETTGYAARIFLYEHGRLTSIPPPRSRLGRLFPVNVVIIGPRLLAATFDDTSGYRHPFLARLRRGRVFWSPLRLSRGLGQFAYAEISVDLALPGRRLVGLDGRLGGGPVVWTPARPGYHPGRYLPTGAVVFGQAVRAVDQRLDEVAAPDSFAIWPHASSAEYWLSMAGLPRTGHALCLDLGYYGYDIAQASRPAGRTRTVYVAGVYQARCHVTDEVLWRLRVRGRRVVWASRPALIRGAGPYRDLVTPPPIAGGAASGFPSNGGGLTPTGRLSGAMGWYRKRPPPQAWCVLAPRDEDGRWWPLSPACWSSQDHLHGYLYIHGHTYDLNRLVRDHNGWTIEAATSGVPGSEEFSYGPSMNARGDIIAVGYRDRPDQGLAHQCRTEAVWRPQRALCLLSAQRGPETALILTPRGQRRK